MKKTFIVAICLVGVYALAVARFHFGGACRGLFNTPPAFFPGGPLWEQSPPPSFEVRFLQKVSGVFPASVFCPFDHEE